MYNMVKLSFIAFVLLLISCSNDFPPAPEFKFCKFKLDDDTKATCKSIYVIPESDCKKLPNWEIVNTCGTD